MEFENSPKSVPVDAPMVPPVDGMQQGQSMWPASATEADNPGRRSSMARPGSFSGGRRTSVQFVPHLHLDRENSRSRNPVVIKENTGRRLSSPPPPNQFRDRVSFDTFDNRDAPDFSLTLNRKHKDYAYGKRTRTFLCGTDANDYSNTALEWLIDELVDDGDEIVCLRVVEKDSKEAQKYAGGGLSREGREKSYRREAQQQLERIQYKNTEDKAINLVLEFSIGKVQDMIQQMIKIYEPAILVVGTRGRSLKGFQGLLPGSVSKYCLQHSPVPVIVVRPSSKRDKKKRKRMEDPARRGYRDILDKSEDVAEGGHILDERNRRSIIGTEGLELGKFDEEEEARMVAEAIGYRSSQRGSADGETGLTRITSATSARSGRSARSSSFGSVASDSPEEPRTPLAKLMKSPEFRDMDSPPGSDSDSDFDGEAEGVSAYVKAQEDSLQRARDRAIKMEEEEKEREREVARKKENKRLGIRETSPPKGGTEHKGADVLAILDALDDDDATWK